MRALAPFSLCLLAIKHLGCHARGGGDGHSAALQFRDTVFEDRSRGVHDASVNVAQLSGALMFASGEDTQWAGAGIILQVRWDLRLAKKDSGSIGLRNLTQPEKVSAMGSIIELVRRGRINRRSSVEEGVHG
jgi:hypothetical protein